MQNDFCKRARAMMALVAAAMQLPQHLRAAQMDAIGPYKSRGKGRGTPSRNWFRHAGNNGGTGLGPHQGKQEMARRAARGW